MHGIGGTAGLFSQSSNNLRSTLSRKKVTAMDEMTNDEKLAWLDSEYAKAQEAGDHERMLEVVNTGKQWVIDEGGVRMAELQGIADLLETAINMTLKQIIDVATQAGAPFIPIDLLRDIMDGPKPVIRAFWAQTEDVVRVDVPDDLSGLEV
jgi:hypothetical protein